MPTKISKTYVPSTKEKYMCAKHKAYFRKALVEWKNELIEQNNRIIFDNDDDKNRAKNMGIINLNKKYSLNEIISGDSIFCATGITSGDLVKGISVDGKTFTSETLVTHKSENIKENISKTYDIE